MNTNFTKNPIVGTPLTPSVIKQIHTAVRRYMPIAGNGIRTSVTAGGTIISAIPAPAPKKQKDKPLPFEVRYDGTLDSGAGGWKIYLPTEHLLQFDGTYLDPLDGVTPILDANGDETGWYSFDEITLHDDHVWLVISESSGSGAHTASFENAEDQYAVANICIAEVSYEAATESTPETIDIKQSVVGAIVMSSGGGGTTGYTGTLTRMTDITWDTTYHKLVLHYAVETYANGLLTAVAAGQDSDINTTAISSILNNS